MTLDQLEIVLELAKTHSMSVCAENLGVAKTNVSRAIATLEEELSVQLFFKSRKGSYLTPAGELLIPLAEDILRTRDAISTLYRPASAPQEPLNIVYTDAQTDITQHLAEMLSGEHGSARLIRMHAIAFPHQANVFKSLQPDAGLGYVLRSRLNCFDAYRDDVVVYKVYESPLQLLVSSSSVPKSRYAEIAQGQLSNYNLLLMGIPPSSNEEDDPAASFFDGLGFSGQMNVTRCNSTPMVKRMLKRNYAVISDGYAIRHNFTQELESGQYRSLIIKPEATMVRYIYIRKSSPYFAAISSALVVLYNQNPDEFTHFERIV